MGLPPIWTLYYHLAMPIVSDCKYFIPNHIPHYLQPHLFPIAFGHVSIPRTLSLLIVPRILLPLHFVRLFFLVWQGNLPRLFDSHRSLDDWASVLHNPTL